MVEFADFTAHQYDIVEKIVQRAIDARIYDNAMDAHMDVAAVYVHCPLRLDDLLATDNFNFAHDLYGIQRYINRKTGKLEHCFLPRFAI